MTTVSPQTITPTTVSNSWTGATYVWKETVGTSEIYTLAFNGVATNNNHEIQVDTTTNTWSDYGTNNPNTVVDNGNTVSLSSGTTTFVVFNKPTSASWTSSGGGTSTEDVATIDDAIGSLSNTPSFSEIDVSISALSPGGSDYTYTLLKDNVTIDYRNSHVNGTESQYTVDYSVVGQYGVWDLTVMEVSTVTIKHLRRLTLVDPNAPVQKRKVHSNFW